MTKREKRPLKISRGTTYRLLISALLLLIAAVIYLAAKYMPNRMFPWYQDVSRRLLSLWANVTDLLPFSLFEWMFFGFIWLGLGWGILCIEHRRGFIKLLTTAALIASVIINLFVVLWGADQFAPTFTSTTEYTETSYTVEEAEEACAYLVSMANAYAEEMPTDADGVTDLGSFEDMASGVESGYRWMESVYGERFAIGNVNPKGMVFSHLMDLTGFTGMFTAYTGEMSMNVNTPDQSLPYAISHECAHRTTCTQESDANFTAFLACIHSEYDSYRYSGYYSAMIYVYNAIAKQDKDAQSRLWSMMSERVRVDVLSANAYYAQFESKTQTTAQNINSSYLKTFNQSNGVANYGAVAGPIIAWYWAEIAE